MGLSSVTVVSNALRLRRWSPVKRAVAASFALLLLLPALPCLAEDVTMPLILDGTFNVRLAGADKGPEPMAFQVTDLAPLVAAGKIVDDRYDCHIWASAYLSKNGKRAEVAAESLYCYRKRGSARDTVRFKAEGTILAPDGRSGVPVKPLRRMGEVREEGLLERGAKAIFSGNIAQEVCQTVASPSVVPAGSRTEIRSAEPPPLAR
jgi:hypothetical protein